VPKSRLRRVVRGMKSGGADSPSLRWEMESARYRWSRACSFEVQRLTGLLAVMREKYRETYKLNLNEYG